LINVPFPENSIGRFTCALSDDRGSNSSRGTLHPGFGLTQEAPIEDAVDFILRISRSLPSARPDEPCGMMLAAGESINPA
jgi:hypothetical protein